MDKIISKKVVIDTLGRELNLRFSSHGFKFIKSKESLLRKNKNGFDQILFITYSGAPYSHQELNLQFTIRINLVEEIVSKFYDDRFRNMLYAKDYHTVALEYADLKHDSDKSFTPSDKSKCDLCDNMSSTMSFVLHTFQQVKEVTEFLGDFIELRGFPFFDKYRNLGFLNVAFKKKLISSNSPLDLHSIMTSLVLMKLNKDEQYHDFEKLYEKSLLPMSGFEKESFEALREIQDYLKKFN